MLAVLEQLLDPNLQLLLDAQRVDKLVRKKKLKYREFGKNV
jgi:hypothetical protein